MSDCCNIKKVATVTVYENKNEVKHHGYMAGDRNTPVLEVIFRHFWDIQTLKDCKLRWVLVDDTGSLVVGETSISGDNKASIPLPNELFNGERRMKVQLTVASCDGARILNLQQITDLKVISSLATNEIVEPVYGTLINGIYDETQKCINSIKEYLLEAENGGNAEYLQGYSPNDFEKIEQTVNALTNAAKSKYVVGNVVSVLGYYTAGDGAHHKRVIETTLKPGGVKLASGLYANVIATERTCVSWFGAKGDGVTNDTTAFDDAFSFLPRYSTLYVPSKTYKGNFTFRYHQVFGSGNTTFIANDNNVPIITLKDPSGWDYQTFKDCKVDGKNQAKICISFGRTGTDRYDGRWLIKNVSINNSTEYSVKKPGGNIGVHWEECDWNNGPVLYYAHNEGTQTMHVGCDTFYKCHFGGATKAVWYYKENDNTGKEEGGQIIIRDCIAEGNVNSAVFIADNFGYGAVPIVIENLWLELNSQKPNTEISINGKSYKARELHIENVGKFKITGTYIHSSYFKDSVATIENCEISDSFLSQNYAKMGQGVQLESVNSTVTVKNCFTRCGWNQDDNDKSPLTVTGHQFVTPYVAGISALYYSSQPNNIPVKRVANCEKIYVNKNETYDSRIKFEGDRIKATIVNDGVMGDTCLEYEAITDGGWTHASMTPQLGAYIGKCLVMSFSIKAMNITDRAIMNISAGSGGMGLLRFKKAGEWNHVRMCVDISSALTVANLGFWFDKSPVGFKFRVQNVQILIFDNRQEATAFLDSGAFLDSPTFKGDLATSNFKKIGTSYNKVRTNAKFSDHKSTLSWVGGATEYSKMQVTDYQDEDTNETLKKYRVPELNSYYYRPYIYKPEDNGKWSLHRCELKFFNIDKDRTFGFNSGSGNFKSGEFEVSKNDNGLWRTHYTITQVRDDMSTHPFNCGFIFSNLPVGTEFACRSYSMATFDTREEAEKIMNDNLVMI